MDLLLIAVFLVALYFLIAGYIKTNNLWEEHIRFYGPILALKTDNVGFFDKFLPYSRFLKLYGTAGAVMVVIVSLLFSVLMIFSFQKTLASPPAPTGIYEPQNILAIPGINEFLPLSFAVIIAFIVTLVVHEFGHGILARIEGMRVESTGVLFFVIPIGAFVEPCEEDVEKASGRSKIRMFGAGITNNLVVALIAFLLLALFMGMAHPVDAPYVKAVYAGYPADDAGLLPNSLIISVNGIDVTSREDVTSIMSGTKPGDTVSVTSVHEGRTSTNNLKLTEWPEEYGDKNSGFMGVSYYDSSRAKELSDKYIRSPLGPLLLVYVPINAVIDGDSLGLGILAFDSPDTVAWSEPFYGYWQLIQILFWLFWFNFAVATFNALPLIPLDGGYIMQEGVKNFFAARNKERYADYIVSGISWLMIFIIVSLIMIPYIASF
jgi:membrane-associated protease RseP (regulator of RpoE activity)